MFSSPAHPSRPKKLAGWTALVVLVLASLSCQAVSSSFKPAQTPSSTPDPLATQEISLTATETPFSAPAQTATSAPPGKVVNVSGVVQEIRVENNITIIIVNGVAYRVPPEILVVIIQHLRVGAPIVFTGRVDASGVIIIVTVVKIDNVVIVVNPPEKHGGDDEDEDEDD